MRTSIEQGQNQTTYGNLWRTRLATLASTAVALAGANALRANTAEADCTTTVNGNSTVTTCNGGGNTVITSPGTETPPAVPVDTPEPTPSTPHHSHHPSTPSSPPKHRHPHHPHHQKPPKHHHPHHPTGGVGVYQNPFRAEMRNGSLKPYRIDEGVDYRGHGKVYAIGPAILKVATNSSSFFANEGGQNTVYKLTAGEAKGKYVFVGEACKPRPGLVGHKVTAHTVICHMHGDHFPGIETGWWNPRTDTPMAYPDYTPSGNPDGSKTAFGVNFSELLKSLGTPGGNTVHQGDRMSTNPGRTVGHLPHNWPRW